MNPNDALFTAAKLDTIIGLTEPHISEMVNELLKLARAASRCATRERAASKLIGLFADAVSRKAQVEVSAQDDPEHQVKVLIVPREDIPLASKRALVMMQEQRLGAGK